MNWKYGTILIALVFMVGCSPATITPTDANSDARPTSAATAPTGIISSEYDIRQFTTQTDLSGNHFINGSVDLQNTSSIDIPLDGTPVWLVSGPSKSGVIFVAVMENGTAQAFRISGKSYEPIEISPSQLPAGMPPTLLVEDEIVQLIVPPNGASLLTNPILVGDQIAYIASNGDLVLGEAHLSINALPDARILLDEKDRILVLTSPTNRYAHAVVGDEIEASAITLIETSPELRIVQTISINEPDVIEGISPIWADIDNDGVHDIIVTLSNSQTGARIVAYREDGTLLAESEPIGRGNRWRHQLAVAGFELNKPPLLVDIRTPHIGGIVEFFQYNNGKLESVKEIMGFSTHSIGSRNLDSALAGDFNNDGVIELLAPDQKHTSLGIISLDGVLATLPLDGTLASNLSAAAIDGTIYIGAGTQNNLRIWIP